jgi:hypothetical protein
MSEAEPSNDPPKIQIDSDWKAQAQAEKQRLAEQSKSTGDAKDAADASAPFGGTSGAGKPGELPPANFETLLSTFVTTALFALGMIADPRSGQPALDLDLARHQIDMLAVLEEKTKGNLTDEETQALNSTLYELRGRYVQVVQASRGA